MSNPNPDEVAEAVARAQQASARLRNLERALLDLDYGGAKKLSQYLHGNLQVIDAALRDISALPPPTSAALSGGGWSEAADWLVREVCELPDRSSPDDQPEMLLVTCTELHWIAMEAFGRLSPAQPPNAPSIGDGEGAYDGRAINAVLTLVVGMSADGDVQLSILAYALVVACKSTQVERETALVEIGRLWDRDHPLVPLRQAPPQGGHHG